jgi:hypothetical protein
MNSFRLTAFPAINPEQFLHKKTGLRKARSVCHVSSFLRKLIFKPAAYFKNNNSLYLGRYQ